MILLAFLSFNTYAGQDHTCQGGHNCNSGSPVVTTVTNQGGEGGNGGSVGYVGASADNTNALTNTNTNANTSTNTNANNNFNNTTSNSSSNSSSGSFSGSSAYSQGGNAHSNATGGNAAVTNHTSATGGAVNASGNTTGNSTVSTGVTVEGNRVAASSVAGSPPMLNGSDQCMVVTGVGGAGVGFGFNVGVAQHDEVCERIKLARMMIQMRLPSVALAILSEDKRVSKALKDVVEGKFEYQ
ncbi:MAG: hypothetical protein ACYC9D_12920 [Candidatus Dormibacteria bacterium]